MRRAALIAFAAGFLAVQICCAPPLRAAAVEAAEPMHCPLQKQECETAEKSDCEAQPPLIAESPSKAGKSLGPSSFVLGIVSVESPTTNDERRTTGWWAAPTRTIQLRI